MWRLITKLDREISHCLLEILVICGNLALCNSFAPLCTVQLVPNEQWFYSAYCATTHYLNRLWAPFGHTEAPPLSLVNLLSSVGKQRTIGKLSCKGLGNCGISCAKDWKIAESLREKWPSHKTTYPHHTLFHHAQL